MCVRERVVVLVEVDVTVWSESTVLSFRSFQ